MKRTCFVLIMLALSGCAALPMALPGDYHAVPLGKVGASIPIVYGRLNDKEACFIIDTGASATMLNKSFAQRYAFANKIGMVSERELRGLGGTVLFETLICKIQIGTLAIHHRVLNSNDLNGLFAQIYEREKVEIAGVIGSDILQQYGLLINFDTNTLSYKMTKKIQKLITDL